MEKSKKLTVKAFFDLIADMENTVYQVKMVNQFKKSIDLSYSRGFSLQLLYNVIEMLAQDQKLPEKYKAHELKGDRKGMLECHIKPDWVLMWSEHKKELILILLDTATHSDFMGKRKK
jgi:mRNA interferase YafQ